MRRETERTLDQMALIVDAFGKRFEQHEFTRIVETLTDILSNGYVHPDEFRHWAEAKGWGEDADRLSLMADTIYQSLRHINIAPR